jgi:polyhydroxybutyrate depolymerase
MRNPYVRVVLLVLIAALLAIAGFARPMHVLADPSAVSVRSMMTFGGLERSYHLYRPATLKRDAPVPLVIVLHGGFGTGTQAENTYHWDRAADAHGFVVVYPDGLKRAWNAGACCGYPMQQKIDDVGFITALVNRIVRDENVDPRRIYSTGISNGAFMSYRLACESPLTLAAIGPVAGTFSKPCEHPKPTSVIAIHGLADRNVPFNGGVGVGFDKSNRPSVPSTIARWREVDRCTAPIIKDAAGVHDETSQCAEGRVVKLITIDGAGHQWPGSETPPPAAVAVLHLDQPSQAFDATAVLWEFFAAHHS